MGMENEEVKNANRKEKLKAIWKWAYRLRSVVLAVPVAVGAVIIAIHNQARLPGTVGFNMQASGEYAFVMAKPIAVLGPVAITAVCLLMTFCSRKVLYPWLISLFSLLFPIFIYFTNTFPG